MQKIALICLSILFSTSLFAKKVKFAVNMKNEVVNVTGVHVTGNFQNEAGFPLDWDPGTTELFQETLDTNIYSAVFDIPAFTEYEFKFVNGIFGYEVEFVPLESRVNTTSNDSRWIYIDSLSNDTQVIAAVHFAGNAPQGKYLMRFGVDMSTVTVSPLGVHVAGAFQNWNPATTRLWSFGNSVYEYIAYVDTGINTFQHQYKFANGNTISNYELISGWCPLINNNRYTTIPKDSVLPIICFATCASCSSAGVNELSAENDFNLYPNPISENDNGTIEFSDMSTAHTVTITDVCGRMIRSYLNIKGHSLTIAKNDLNKGIYFISVSSVGNASTKKLIIQ